MSASSLPRAVVLAASVLAVTLLSTCSSKDSTSPSSVVTGPTFDFRFTMTGTSQERAFPEVGTWNYHCSAHGGMNGTVNVDASSVIDSALVNVGSGGNFFNPDNVTIKQNGKVRWVNVSGTLNHTVTR